jgi:hypothetical protein
MFRTRTMLLTLFRFGRPLALVLSLLSITVLPPAFGQQRAGELLRNGEFEGGGGSDGMGGGVPEWSPFETGYDVDRRIHHGGDQSIRCDSLRTQTRRGAFTQVVLNQNRPIPIVVTGWSRADEVGGVKDNDYSIYVDLEYVDGTPLWGQVSAFPVGTHDWQRRQVLIIPAKPVKSMRVNALFRHHTGTAWFDDFSAHPLDGAGIYDSQPLLPLPKRETRGGAEAPGLSVAGKDGLSVHFSSQGDISRMKVGGQDITSSGQGGFYLRDVEKDGPIVAMRGHATAYHTTGVNFGCAPVDMQIGFYAKMIPQGEAIAVDGELTDQRKTDRAVTVYLALPVGANGWTWGQDIRRSRTLESGEEFSNLTHVDVGATGAISLYPYGCVSNAQAGIGIASQMDWPSVHRIFYNGTTRQLVIAWDFALTGKTAAWPSHNARFRCTLFRLPQNKAAWGFRAATERFYRLNAPIFRRLARAEGIWIPFTDPAKVDRPADFGFAYHEGDNSLKSDDALGILSFRYTEPMTYWLPMPPEMPRTYENALALVHKNAQGDNKEARDFARAILNSGTQDENGHFNLEFRNEPWANGAVFVLNPNPELPASPDKPTKASLSYTVAMAMKMYGDEAKKTRGDQDGEYLDSLEGWADTQDYRPSHLLTCPYPLPFDLDSRRPVLPQWYSTYAFARFLRDDLHNRGKLLMANTVPVRFSIYAPLMDAMGIEVNWLDAAGKWSPDSDETFNLRRTLSAQKPYLLLMNTDFDRFPSALVEKYFQRSLFYGVYPSMFSVNAADRPYWENPRWYNRDRPLFRKYIPILKRLSAAGWEPVTDAHSSRPSVFVERYGARLFTALNSAPQPTDATLTIDLRPLGLQTTSSLHAVNLITDTEIPAQRDGASLSLTLHLNPEETQAIELR